MSIPPRYFGLRGYVFCRPVLGAILLIASAPGAGAAENSDGGGTGAASASPRPAPSTSPSVSTPRQVNHSVDTFHRMHERVSEQILGGAPSNQPQPPLRIFFPPHPPPLGVTIQSNRPGPLNRLTPEELRGEILEPYFAPLSTRLVERNRKLSSGQAKRLAAYRAARDRALQRLRETIAACLTEPPDLRFQRFTALARAQEAELSRLEAEAEGLRHDLARGVNWFKRRRWRLGAGPLDRPREENRLLEYQVLRAAAFYLDGLQSFQRRLLREAAQLLEEAEFGEDEEFPDTGAAFPFFAPDLMRIPRAPFPLPPELEERLRRFGEAKAQLRREVRDAIYTTERTWLHFTRRHALERLAAKQAPVFAQLEEEAEAIRRALAPHRESHRRVPPAPLPEELQQQIDEYLAGKQALQRRYEDYIIPLAATWPRPERRNDPAALVAWQAERRQRESEAMRQFLAAEHETVARLAGLIRKIEDQLQPFLLPGERALAGSSSDVVLMEFLLRFREQHAYHEYEIAAFEPGLSAAQRRLLFAGAVVRLELPLAGPERQPLQLPGTFVR